MSRPSLHELGRRDVLALLVAGAATFQARIAGAATPSPCPQPTPANCDCQKLPTGGVLKKPLLISLVSDLIRDQSIRDKFNVDPGNVVGEYGLPEESLAVFYTMNLPCIHDYITAETSAWNAEFQCYKPDDDLKIYPWNNPGFETDEGCDVLADPAYPKPTPQIKLFRPKSHTIQQPLELHIYGQSFPRDVQVVLEGPKTLNPTDVVVEGTFRSSHVTASFRTSSLLGAQGTYAVKVIRRKVASCPLEVKAKCDITLTD